MPLPSSIRPEYPPELEAIVMRALQADPDNRYATAVDLQIDLEDFAREARLPVSSARLGRFMRELFDEEIERSRAEVVADRTRVEAAAMGGGTVIVPPSSPPDGVPGVDLTPSELRHFGGEPTPGLVDENSGTDIALAPVKKRVSTGTLVAVGGGFLATLIGVTVAMSGGTSETAEQDQAPAAGGEVQVIESVVAEDPDEVEGDPAEPAEPGSNLGGEAKAADSAEGDPGDPIALGPPSGDGPPDEPEPVDTLGDPAGDPEADSAGAESAGEDPKAEDPPAPATPTKPRRPRRNGGKKPKAEKPEKKPPTTKPDKPKSRPKYDPDQPLPPGMSFGGGKK